MKQLVMIEKIGRHQVYDIEVDDAQHYVLSNGLISHNSGSKYAASVTIGLTKAKEKDGEEHTGSIISCTVIKSRLTREGLKVKTLIRFNGGLDRYYGLLDIAEKAGVFKKVSTKYEMPDGKKFFGKTIERDPEKFFTADVLQQIDAYVQKEFRYGVGGDEDTTIPMEIDDDQE
jgi:hypothetical protein